MIKKEFTMQKRMITIGLVLVFALSIIAIYGQAEAFQSLYKEYLDINKELQTIQNEALKDETLKKMTDEFSNLVDKRLLKMDKELEPLLKKRDSLMQTIEKAEAEGDFETVEKLHGEYLGIVQTLQPQLNAVLKEKDIAEQNEELEKKVIIKMREIDPNTNSLLARLEEITKLLQELSSR